VGGPDLSPAGVSNAHLILALVVVGHLDLERVAIDEPKADAPLIIDGNGVLTLAIVSKCMKPVAGRHPQVVETRSQVHVLEFPRCALGDVRRNRLDLPVAYKLRVSSSANVWITRRPV
jgi:hypothetical protein